MNSLHFIKISVLVLFVSAFTIVGVKLKQTSLLDGKVEIKLPADFKLMSEEMKKLKYPSANRPDLIYTNEPGSINVAFSHTASPMNDDVLPIYLGQFVSTMKQQYPDAAWKGSDIKEVNGQKVGYLKLVTPAVDTDIYNVLFFTELDGKMLLCTFNCTKEYMEKWTPIADEIMHSLKIK